MCLIVMALASKWCLLRWVLSIGALFVVSSGHSDSMPRVPSPQIPVNIDHYIHIHIIT